MKSGPHWDQWVFSVDLSRTRTSCRNQYLSLRPVDNFNISLSESALTSLQFLARKYTFKIILLKVQFLPTRN